MADNGQRPASDRRDGGRLARLVSRCALALRRIAARRGEHEVFPWLEQTTAVAALIGAAGCLGLGLLFALEPNGLILVVTLGATLGALAGIALAVSWAVSPPAVMATPAAEPVDLWDPWLDRGGEDEPEPEAEPAIVIADGPAIVRPRVRSAATGESVPLEDEIGPILANHERGAIRLSGPPGSGKSTALAYLSGRVPAHFQTNFLEASEFLDVTKAALRGRVVFALATKQGPSKLLATLELAPWGRDDCIEYLLVRNSDRCASVMGRLEASEAEAGALEGLPELWRIVLDRMAEDESVAGPREALRVELDRRLDHELFRLLIEDDCLAAIVRRHAPASAPAAIRPRYQPDECLSRLVRHRAVRVLLAADRLADSLAQGIPDAALVEPLPRDLVREAALRIARLPAAVEFLGHLVTSPDEEARQPMAASLLHALEQGWKPAQPAPCLKGAYLEGADWSGVDLSGADLQQVDLGRANLWYARLDRAKLRGARLAGANLRSASLEAAQLEGANLNRARLLMARARRAQLGGADLSGADFSQAQLDQANLWRCSLSGARFVGCRLVGACLVDAELGGSDLRKADLSKADLKGLNLTGAQLEGACFRGANLMRCNLEGVVLADARFSESNLAGAHFTGSRMRGGDFQGASLRGAGLAEVDWQEADLRGADLREAAFHLGSSRSGMVGSPIACEGSRTGFYTDDFNDQDFKSPEEIRKANLCEADLRGAKIDGVDFYLVDLRGARVDADQISHLRRSGAILESRA